MAVKPIPDGYTSVTPYLAVDDEAPDGKIAHAELEIGDSLVMLSDVLPQFVTKSPKDLGASSASILLYVEDVDAVVKQAVDAGATVATEVADQFWGDRFGTVIDPYGHAWSIATHVEDVPPEEMAERAKAAMAALGG
jgi:PhnB protein